MNKTTKMEATATAIAPREVTWRRIDGEFVSQGEFEGESILKVEPEALTQLAREAFHDIAHYLRPAHLQQLRAILEDPDASANDRFVALDKAMFLTLQRID